MNSPKICFRFRIDINWTDDLSHSCPHRYFTPNFTFAFAIVIHQLNNSEIISFRFAFIAVSMVFFPISGRGPEIDFFPGKQSHKLSVLKPLTGWSIVIGPSQPFL